MDESKDLKVNAGIGLRPSLIAALKEQALQRGLTYSELCRQYLEWGLAMDGAGNCPVTACTPCDIWRESQKKEA